MNKNWKVFRDWGQPFCLLQDLYRKDCNLAAQLLQCSKSHYRAHKMSEVSSPTLLLQLHQCVDSNLCCKEKTSFSPNKNKRLELGWDIDEISILNPSLNTWQSLILKTMDSVGTHNVLRYDTPPIKDQHLHQHFIPGWLKKDFKNYLDPRVGKYTLKRHNLTGN